MIAIVRAVPFFFPAILLSTTAFVMLTGTVVTNVLDARNHPAVSFSAATPSTTNIPPINAALTDKTVALLPTVSMEAAWKAAIKKSILQSHSSSSSHVVAVRSNARSSSSVSAAWNAWNAFRARVHRGGGGSTQHADAPATDASSPSPSAPSITFNAITKTYGDPAFVLSPTSNSAGGFTYVSSDTNVATVSGNTVTITGVGSTTITATQAAAGNFTSGSTTATLTVNALAPTIAFNTIAKNYGDPSFSLSPTSNSAGSFTYISSNTGVATISGNTVTIVAAGTTTITATEAANGNYASGSADATLTVNKIAPTFAMFSKITKQMGDIPFTVSTPTSNSNGAISYVIANPSIATVSGNTVTLVGPGTTTITASQAASTNYLAASTGTLLRVVVGACTTAPCENGGVCTNQPGGSYSCSCGTHYSGMNCEMDDLNCYNGSGFECLNGGTCTPSPTHGECFCIGGFFGSRCDQSLSEAYRMQNEDLVCRSPMSKRTQCITDRRTLPLSSLPSERSRRI